MAEQIMKIRKLGLEAYLRPGYTARWLLPVCSEMMAKRLSRLNPNHIGNWVHEDIDGCPTICYVLTTRHIRALNATTREGAFAQLADALGIGPAKAFFYDLWLCDNNHKAMARNKWERKHGGIRAGRFDRGMGVRKAAKYSIV